MQTLVLSILFFGVFVNLLGGQEFVLHALGRSPDLTGRTAIWAAVLPQVPNPVLGAGFESFWLGPRLDVIYDKLGKFQHINEAHNGYIEIYLNLGVIGLALIGTMLVSGYRGAIALFRHRPGTAGILLAYVAVSASYSISEAGFRLLGPMWFFLLIGVLGSRGTLARIKETKKVRVHTVDIPGDHGIASAN